MSLHFDQERSAELVPADAVVRPWDRAHARELLAVHGLSGSDVEVDGWVDMLLDGRLLLVERKVMPSLEHPTEASIPTLSELSEIGTDTGGRNTRLASAMMHDGLERDGVRNV